MSAGRPTLAAALLLSLMAASCAYDLPVTEWNRFDGQNDYEVAVTTRDVLCTYLSACGTMAPYPYQAATLPNDECIDALGYFGYYEDGLTELERDTLERCLDAIENSDCAATLPPICDPVEPLLRFYPPSGWELTNSSSSG